MIQLPQLHFTPEEAALMARFDELWDSELCAPAGAAVYLENRLLYAESREQARMLAEAVREMNQAVRAVCEEQISEMNTVPALGSRDTYGEPWE